MRIGARNQDIKGPNDAFKTHELWTEVQALQRLLSMAKKHKAGEALLVSIVNDKLQEL